MPKKKQIGLYKLYSVQPKKYKLVKSTTTISDINKYAKQRKFRFVKDRSLFGGYYVDKKGNTYHPDIKPTVIFKSERARRGRGKKPIYVDKIRKIPKYKSYSGKRYTHYMTSDKKELKWRADNMRKGKTLGKTKYLVRVVPLPDQITQSGRPAYALYRKVKR